MYVMISSKYFIYISLFQFVRSKDVGFISIPLVCHSCELLRKFVKYKGSVFNLYKHELAEYLLTEVA